MMLSTFLGRAASIGLIVTLPWVGAAASAQATDSGQIVTTAELRGFCDPESETFSELFCVGFLWAGANAAHALGQACLPSQLANAGLHFLFMVGSENELERRPEAADITAIEMIMALSESQFPCEAE